MIRESVDAAARNLFLTLTPGAGSWWQSRSQTGGDTTAQAGPNLAPPYWLRWQRTGSLFTASLSPDGTTWTTVGTVTNAMPTTVLAGVAVTSRNPYMYCGAVFDNVSVTSVSNRAMTLSATATPGIPTAQHQGVQFQATASGGGFSTPVLNSDNQQGVASAQGEYASGGQRAINAFDDSLASSWLDFATNNPATRASWLQYAYPAGQACVLTGYALTSAGDTPARDPRDWRVWGGNDGTNWDLLDTRTGETFTNRSETHTYTISNATAYAIYRLQIDTVAAPATAGAVQLAEWKLLTTTTGTYQWWLPDGAVLSQQNPYWYFTTNGTFLATVVAADGQAGVTNTAAFSILLTNVPPPVWLPATVNHATGQFQIQAQVAGNYSYLIEATTNFINWTVVSTNAGVGGILTFQDQQSASYPARFYRVRQP